MKKEIGMMMTAVLTSGAVEPPSEPMSIWFTKPACSFHESCPLGNGRLGAMDFGGMSISRIVLNESTVWSGGPYEANRPEACKCLPEARESLFSGNPDAAGKLLRANFQYRQGVSGWWDANQFGCYQILGDLTLRFKVGGKGTVITSPSGHDALGARKETHNDVQPVANSIDGTGKTKWYVRNAGNAGSAVIWQSALNAPQTIPFYTRYRMEGGSSYALPGHVAGSPRCENQDERRYQKRKLANTSVIKP